MWTEKQKEAIDKRNSNILVSASAGSGKTAVLVERVINRVIDDNVDINKLLIVTFTNASASELKERLLKRIYEALDKDKSNAFLKRQIQNINIANIETIHSFCLKLIRANFDVLEIDPNIKIVDESYSNVLKIKAINNVLEKLYIKANKDNFEKEKLYKFLELFSSKDDKLTEYILKIYSYINSFSYPFDTLKSNIEKYNQNLDNIDLVKTDFGKEIYDDVISSLNLLLLEGNNKLKLIEAKEDFVKIYEILDSEVTYIKSILDNADSWDKLYTMLNNFSFSRMSAYKGEDIDLKEDVLYFRNKILKKEIEDLKKQVYETSSNILNDNKIAYEYVSYMYDIIFEFDKKYSKLKQDAALIDFNDIEHLALKLLVKKDENGNYELTEIAKQKRSEFEEIYTDEYQDTSMVQETILQAISNNNNRFMVGDVKQSIYKFRQAMPELFLSKYNTYKNTITNNDDNLKIQLFKNFRSRENILDFTNLIFQNIMSENLGDVNYNHEEYLNLGATDYKKPEQNLNTEVYLIDTKEKQDEEEQEEHYEDIELEAKFVAKKIKELIDNKFQVYDRKKECFRDIKYSDIAILLRSTKQKANIFEQEIINQKMGVFSDTSQEYLDSIEIQTIISLLKIIDNPMQDIPLVTVLRSNIGKFTDNDLVTIRLNDKYDDFYTCLLKSRISVEGELKEKIETFLSNLKMWQEEQEYLALDELIWKIYSDTGFYNYCGLMPNGNLRQANLRALFERAKQYEQASFKGLYNFIKFIDKLKLGSGDLGSAKLIGENDNVIRIMSIHKSKGLEFPVVFLANVGKQFNMQSLKIDPILLHSKLGIGMKYINHNIQVEYDTNAKIAVKNKLIQESISEEMRVLYVALTRAKEKLIITGISKDYEKDIEKIKKQVQIYGKVENKINPILLKKCKSYLDWIMLVSVYNKFDFEKIANIEVLEKNKLNTNSKEEVVEKINIQEKLSNNKQDEKKLKQIKEEIEYKYKFIQSSITPTKTSVSEIKLNNQEKINSIELTKPKFINNDEEKQVSPARKGSLVHMCMQYLNPKIDYLENNVKELINNLYEKNIITLKEMQAINPFKILQFTKSKIWQQMKTATKIYREKPFYIEVEANKINSNNNLDKVLVQGIIDLYYITKDDELVLVDYKTDYVQNEEELISKYKVQLDLYKVALEQALQRKVDKIYIYSVYLNKEIDINL